ncbi:glucose 1-dehydrogenase [Nocardioides carbamazepini]|uniref:SDR family NAD(P)-dependent oxidoreductase n=1 Tax=Nocardioides carbamazepini TaxID=2854259 RepID=UPI00214A1662|nr:glucose 1-dehydrogenase [Nocardioides carbamazepini]MCR1781889.1 glucose 1-dehydrogenase [Nocardioides carbamazepini]
MTTQTVLVTGAGRGIGATIGERFATAGATVVVADIDDAAAADTAARLPGAHALPLDVTDPQAVAAAVDRIVAEHGTLDVLVNNATVCDDVAFLDLSHEQWRREVAVNLDGPFLCTQAALRPMVAQGRGAIVNVASVNAVGYYGNEAYSAAKAGLLSLTRSIAVGFGPAGVRCNAVVPGTIETPVWQDRLAENPDALQRLEKWYPLRRVGSPGDVAAAVQFLASDEAAWISGAALPIDGGLLAGNLRMATEVVAADPAS